MKKGEQTEKGRGISSDAVQAKTGKTWSEWFAILDSAGAVKMGHKQIVAYLSEHHQVAPWWRQMITVGYEQERGLREKHETPEGYQMSASKTVAVPVHDLFHAWSSNDIRARWLPDAGITLRKATQEKSMRVTWVDNKTHLDVNFYSKGDRSSQVTVQHSKLSGKDDVTRMKTYWSTALDELKDMLENQR